MEKIIIALSATVNDEGYVKVNEAYLNAIRNSGGIPSVISPCLDDEYIRNICETSDGFLFCGGEDIDPKYYGEEKSKDLENICSKRDEFEVRLFAAAYKTGKPILGICRGMQGINVFLGGSLHQHVDGHKQTESREEKTHTVDLTNEGILNRILGEETIAVNSFHHQIVKRLADGLIVDAISKEGYIEAFHHQTHHFLLGVQWHPECYYSSSETSSEIFKEFIRACEAE